MRWSDKKNYIAWKIDLNDFPHNSSLVDKIKFFIGYAILAPSTHNSQPWIFSIDENVVSVFFNTERALPIADSDKKYAYISIGCAVENFIIAADYFGFATDINYELIDHLVATIKVQKVRKQKKDDSHLIHQISERRTNRNFYEDRMPNKEFLDSVNQYTVGNIKADAITDEDEKVKIAQLVVSGRENAFSDKGFRRELAFYKRNNFTASHIGMPGFTMGFSNIVSLVAGLVIRNLNVIKLTKDKEITIFKYGTPCFIVISTDEAEGQNWINIGRSFMRIVLEAKKRNIETAVNIVSPALAHLLGNQAQLIIRAGYTKSVPRPSPREEAIDKIIS